MIGRFKHDFDEADPIFQMKEPIGVETDSSTCVSCKLTTFTKDTEKNFCKFCGKCSCNDCFGKERAFPKGKVKDGKRERAKICKLCNRKFLMR